MLVDTLGKPCEYCGEEITLVNASMDHKTPRNNKKVMKKNGEDGSYTDTEIRELDKRENLHIVCRKCNGTKGNFSHEEYLVLLEVFKEYPEIQAKMTKRFNIANLHFGK
jgi:5-methylcytosine-specific restriction endonuclease McrA